jgi:hypothetical protein
MERQEKYFLKNPNYHYISNYYWGVAYRFFFLFWRGRAKTRLTPYCFLVKKGVDISLQEEVRHTKLFFKINPVYS